MEQEILQQLVWIKWLLLVFVILVPLCIVIIAIGIAYAEARIRRRMPQETLPWRDMLERGEAERVVELTRARVSVAPYDAEAPWCLAQGYRRTNDFWRALSTARQLEKMYPEWASHTEPLIRHMERELAKGGGMPKAPEKDKSPEE